MRLGQVKIILYFIIILVLDRQQYNRIPQRYSKIRNWSIQEELCSCHRGIHLQRDDRRPYDSI